jgi:hypothetical protein
MVAGRRIARGVGVTLLAAAVALLPTAPARANPGCNIGDIFNAAANAFGSVTSTACDSTYATGGVGVSAAAAIAFGLAGLVATGNGNTVSQVCGDLSNVGDDLNSIASWLQAAGVSSDVVSTIASIPGLDPWNVAECGCDLEQGVNQLVSDFGDCLCDLVSWIPGVNCNSCTPPPPIQANCALPTNCFIGSSDPACQTNNAIPGCLTVGGTQVSIAGNPICPGNERDGPTGAFVSTQVGDSSCPTLLYCFCPKPLVPTWTSAGPGFGNSVDSGVFTCACPDGTYQAGTAGGIPICLCDYTNQPPKVADTPQGMCPMNLLGSCQSNQIVLNGKCVTPCSDPSMGMTPDGGCCDPNLVTNCGQCCPPGSTPEPNGTCFKPGPIQ